MNAETSSLRKPLRVLHVGVSGRGNWPLKECTPGSGFTPAALCDVNPGALDQAARMTGLPPEACFTDLDQALRAGVADCAILCAPTMLHLPLGRKCIEAGLPLLVEKGMAPDWTSAREFAGLARSSGVPVAVAQNYRYSSFEQTARRAIHDPTAPFPLGMPHLVVYTENRIRPEPKTLNYPFASIWDMSCHHWDTLLFWFGPVAEMTAHAWRADWSAYQHACNTTAHAVFRSGTHVHYLHTHDAARASLDIQLHSEHGALFRQGETVTINARPTANFGAADVRPATEEPALREQGILADFFAYVTEGIEPRISAANNLETMALCEMMTRSITTGRTITREELDV